VEAFPAGDGDGDTYVVLDPTGLADGAITMSAAALFVLSLMDGARDLAAIEAEFAARAGQPLPAGQLATMVQQLDEAGYLDSPAFAAHVASLVEDYRASSTRVSGDAESLGAGPEGLTAMLETTLAGCERAPAEPSKSLAGIIAPHLDYARGAPGYANAYGAVAAAEPPRRVIILGTNHFGRSPGPVATGKDFQTPLGTTPADRAFLDALCTRVGADLCEHEFDHQREHSIELQVVILQHLLGPDAFAIVPMLCHDPCGPTGTKPYDGRGPGLRDVAAAIGELAQADDVPTLIVAGADLSHVGTRFGDERDLDATFLAELEGQDRAALACVVAGRGDDLLETIRSRENVTRICSVGCIYTLLTALPNAEPELLSYHQADDADSGTCVTSAAVALWNKWGKHSRPADPRSPKTLHVSAIIM
jgi:AmmeMemoRadiSam system protein B